MAGSIRVTAAQLNLRAGPGTNFRILTVLNQGEILSAAGAAPVRLNARRWWINVRTTAGVVGWVNDRYTEELPDGGEPLPDDRAWVAQAIETARLALGLPYKWAGESPDEGGFDCSGLVYWAFAAAGKWLPRTAQTQYDATARITRAERAPGDLVFYTQTYPTEQVVTHVAIYVGGDTVLMASDSRGVCLLELDHAWYGPKIYGYGRV
jgi:cell wall-associated NlpC family hydrolase